MHVGKAATVQVSPVDGCVWPSWHSTFKGKTMDLLEAGHALRLQITASPELPTGARLAASGVLAICLVPEGLELVAADAGGVQSDLREAPNASSAHGRCSDRCDRLVPCPVHSR